MGYGGSIYWTGGSVAAVKAQQRDQQTLREGTKSDLSRKEKLAVKWCLEHECGDFPSLEWQEQSLDHRNAASLIADIQHEPINREAYAYLADYSGEAEPILDKRSNSEHRYYHRRSS